MREREQEATLEAVGRGHPWGSSLGVHTCSSWDIAEGSHILGTGVTVRFLLDC